MQFCFGEKMQTKTIADIATYEPVNLVNPRVVASIAQRVVNGNAAWEPLLLYVPQRRAVTGSHRIAAARMIMAICTLTHNWQHLADIPVPTIDVTRYIDEWCRKNNRSFETVPFGNLREVFAGTPIEKAVRKNKEW